MFQNKNIYYDARAQEEQRLRELYFDYVVDVLANNRLDLLSFDNFKALYERNFQKEKFDY